MKAYKILLVEDDSRLVEMLSSHFKRKNWESVSALNGAEAKAQFQTVKPDLVILDRNLPDTDGIEICKHIRKFDEAVKILMLTGYCEELDVVSGLEGGADDYVAKPFRLAELSARISALLRRCENSENKPIHGCKNLNNLKIDQSKRTVFKNHREIILTAKEFDLLTFLANSPGRVYTREQILNNVWHSESNVYEQSINTIIKRLRKKIEVDPTKPKQIETVRSIGYRFNEYSSQDAE